MFAIAVNSAAAGFLLNNEDDDVRTWNNKSSATRFMKRNEIEGAVVEWIEEEEGSEEGSFEQRFDIFGGNEPRGKCKALRALAAEWENTRKAFIDAAIAMGIEPGTAGANWQAGKA